MEALKTAPKKGSRAKQAKNFERDAVVYMAELQNIACHLTQNHRDAEDLVQEVMLKALKNFHRFENGTNCKAWLCTILRNTFINNYRKVVRRPKSVALIEGLSPSSRRRSLPVEPAEVSSTAPWFSEMIDDDVKHALDVLPSDFRKVLLLASIEGLSYKEIAQNLCLPLGTVMSRLHRGRSMLRKALHEYALREGVISK